MHGPRLERLHVGVYLRREEEARQIGEVVHAKGRAKTLMAEGAKLLPLRSVSVGFQHQVPLLGYTSEMVRGEPDAVDMTCLMVVEELLALIQPSKGVLLAAERWEHEFVILEYHVAFVGV